MRIAAAVMISGAALVITAASLSSAAARDHTNPSCDRCPVAHITAEEIQAFLDVGRLDQQVRGSDVGNANTHVAVVHRGRLTEHGNVAEHSHVTEVYYVISGEGLHRTGHDFISSQPRPDDSYAVRLLNGPGHAATEMEGFEEQHLKAGDMLIIPAGTGHQFVQIDDHITYVMVRVDPDKLVPPMSEADAQAYLAGGGPWAR